jgi:hypothetical protein
MDELVTNKTQYIGAGPGYCGGFFEKKKKIRLVNEFVKAGKRIAKKDIKSIFTMYHIGSTEKK